MSQLDAAEGFPPGLNPSDPDPEIDPPEPAEANSRRLKAWMDVGATNIPALVVALGSAVVGGFTLLLRRRRAA